MDEPPPQGTIDSGTLLELLLDNLTDYAIFFLDPAGTIVTWSPGVKAVLGYEAADFLGRPVAVLFTPEDRDAGVPQRELDQARERGRAGDDRWHLRKDGSRVFVSGAMTALRSNGELVAFAKIVRNRTEHLALVRQLEGEKARAAAANEDKDAFMAVLAHELHRPLNAIRGWAHMAVEGQRSPDQISVAMHRILRSTETMLRLVNDLLDVSRIVAGKLRLGVARADLADIVDHAVAEAEAAALDKGINLVVDVLVRPRVDGDPGRLTQVVSNLLSNAVKYTPRGGYVTVTVDRKGDSAQIVVADTGKGIPPDQLPHVFQRFRQLSGEDGWETGLGLGLWISHQLVKAHGGTLTAHSDGTEKGSTFVVTLPAVQDGATARISARCRNTSPRLRFGRV